MSIPGLLLLLFCFSLYLTSFLSLLPPLFSLWVKLSLSGGRKLAGEKVETLHVLVTMTGSPGSQVDKNRSAVIANRIYVLQGGRVVQPGSYQELMNEEGLFADLARRQMA